MARRLIVDTCVLIASERTRSTISARVAPGDDLVIAAVTLAELRTGVLLADASRRAARAELVDRTLAVLPVEPYDAVAAEAHAELLAAVRREGRPRGAHDLLIAATALATDRAILTDDRAARFADLPGVRVLE